MSKENTKFCTRCGHANPEDATVCEQCKNALTELPTTETPTVETPTETAAVVDKPKGKANPILVVLCVFFPIAGLILYFLKKNEGGKTYLKVFIIEMIIGVILGIAAVGLSGALMKKANGPVDTTQNASPIGGLLNNDDDTTTPVDAGEYQYYVPGENYDDIPSID